LAIAGPTLHQGFHFIQDMAIAGTNAFYDVGYDEGKFPFATFSTTTPQQVSAAWFWSYGQNGTVGSNPVNIYDRNWAWVTTDGSWVYFACSATFNPTNLVNNSYPGCIVASKASDHSLASFTAGVVITNGPGFAAGPFPNGIYVGTQPGLSGLAVQANGNVLAAAVAPDNRVYLMNKQSGALLGSFSVNKPGRMNFSPDNSLWVVSGAKVICYTNVAVTPAVALTVSGLSEPLDVAVNPLNAGQIIIADGGSSQQVKAFNSQGTALWTYGLPGGYLTNGPAVATNKFWFNYEGVDQTFLCYAGDGSFWVGDEANHRALHFSGAPAYLESISFQPFSYSACVDLTDPTRVFNQFLEFKVDYEQPLQQSWTLVNDWKVGVDTNHVSPVAEGILDVVTLTNGRTYALCYNGTNNAVHTSPNMEVCELTTNGLRFTGLIPLNATTNRWTSFDANGNIYAIVTGSPNVYEAPLTGFDAKNNPVWGSSTLIATGAAGKRDPVSRWGSFGYQEIAISTNNIVVALDASLNNGMHLGGIKRGSTNWLWEASPAADLNGGGNYEIDNGVNYGGDVVQAVDRNIVYGYHGEFFRSEGQASQHMHYYDDGLFVGQFGEASLWHSPYEQPVPALAGNGYAPGFTRSTNGEYYLWYNDENSHGPQRWHLVNVRNIREQTGSGSLGGNISLTGQLVNFPVGVSAQNGNQCAGLFWRPVAGANSYNIRSSLLNGGPYTTINGSTTGTNFLATGLANGQTYYFVITAVESGNEGVPSEQAAATPFDTRQNVICAGSEAEGAQMDLVVDINSNGPAAGQPAYVGGEYTTGVLNMRERDYYGFGQMANETLGTRGYVIYDWGGPGTNLVNVSSNFNVSPAVGWKNISCLKRYYRVNNVMGAAFDANGTQNNVANGMTANIIGSIPIQSKDSNFHYLTVFSPACYNVSRNAKVGITSTTGDSVYYLADEKPGYSHVYQFIFRGDINLWSDATAGASIGYGGGGIVQAVFLDDAPVAVPTTLMPPSNFHVLP
jgi:hypothetical protein